MTTQFAAGRTQVPSLAAYVTGTAGNVMGGSSPYYFWLQCRARVGYNQPSESFELTVTDNCQVGIVIPAISYLPSEDWHEFLIYANTADDFNTAWLVGTYKALQANQTTRTTLGSNTPLSSDPKQLVLSENYHLNFSSTVAAPANLPVVPLQGMRRFVTSLSRTYRYDADSTATANGDTVLAATTGRWLFSESNNLVENPTNLATDSNGCNQNINLVSGNPDLLLATYDVSGNTGTPIRYYLRSASNTVVPKGTIIKISARIDSQDITADLSELLDITVFGKVQFSDYALVTTNFLSAGSSVPYNHFTENILLEDDILANEALLLSIAPSFAATEIDTNITPSVGLSLYPYFDEARATYSDSNLVVGDLIFDELDNLRVVPYGLGVLKTLSGSGCVNLYTWRNKPAVDLTGYTDATANQKVLVTRTGDVLIGTPTAQRLQRALFSTVAGYSTPCAFSTPSSITSGQTLDYTINIDQDVDGYNPISSVYSDLLLRDLSHRAKLNTNKIALIIKVDTVYKRFIITFDPTLDTVSGTISNWSAGTTITTGDIADFDKNLFKPLSAIHTVGGTGGTIPSGSVSIAYSFYYDGTSVSDISHSTEDGCIPTQVLSNAALSTRYLYWGEGVADITALRAIEKEGATETEARYVASKRHPYHYDSTSTLTDDGDRVIKPDDVTASGRWLADYSNAWFTGTTVPSSTLGDYGDWYLRSDTADLYRKNDAGSWILNSNIRGLSGTVWRSGSGVPSNSLGVNGDYYLNILNSGIYTKASGVYTLQGSLSTQISTVDDLAALTAIDVTTIADGVLRVVKDTSICQYNATATTGGTAPDTGDGQWFKLSQTSSGTVSEIKTADFTAVEFGDYIVNSATDITITYPPSPVDGTPVSFLTINTGRVNAQFGMTINGLYRSDAYFIKDKILRLVYAGSTLGWVCPTTDVFNGIAQGLLAFWNFGTGGSGSLVSSVGSYTLADTGTTPITYTTGIIGAWALNFDNATADYQVSQSSADLSPTTIPFTDTLGFSFLVNLTSGTEPIISQKWTATSDYTFCVRALDSTHIELSVATGGSGAGTFTATATVTATYGVDLLIIVTMPVAYEVKSPRDISIQVGDSSGLGSVIRTVITGVWQTSDNLIIGQTEGGSQIVGVVDQLRAYNFELDSNQRNLLWAGGAFV